MSDELDPDLYDEKFEDDLEDGFDDFDFDAAFLRCGPQFLQCGGEQGGVGFGF